MLLNEHFKRDLEQGVFKNIPGISAYYQDRSFDKASPYSGKADQLNVDSVGQRIGNYIPSLVEKNKVLAPVGSYFSALGQHTPFATMMGAAGGTGLGALAAMLTDRDMGKGALWGAGIGGIGSALASWLMSRQPTGVAKQASMIQDPLTALQAKLLGDSSIGAAQKAQLIQALGALSRPQLDSLAALVRGIIGAGAGALIAKYLLRLGVIGSLAGAALGGMLAQPRAGQLSPTDMFGRTRFVI